MNICIIYGFDETTHNPPLSTPTIQNLNNVFMILLLNSSAENIGQHKSLKCDLILPVAVDGPPTMEFFPRNG